jgi:hypothetical protein
MFSDVSALLQSCNNRSAHAASDPAFPVFCDANDPPQGSFWISKA